MPDAAITAVTIMGPTASGKTDLAVSLAEQYPFEIISVDSAMVYRKLDIGTAKPPPALLERVPHHLIDIRDPAESYSAANFRDDAVSAAKDIAARGKIPLLVGGTMLYFKALKDGLADMPSADPRVRARIQALADTDGWPAVHARLAEVDPAAAARLGENDRSRLQRALEVFEITGRPLTELHDRGAEPCPLNLVEFAIMPDDRAALHEAIAARFQSMLESGLVEEVRSLFDRGDLAPELPAIKAVGYRQVWAHLAGEMEFDEMVRRGIIATRQLAKRQYTWLRSWKGHTALPVADSGAILKKLEAASIL